VSRGLRRRGLLAATLALLAGAAGASGNEEKTMADLFDTAVAQHERAYLDAEARLLAGGDAARQYLNARPLPLGAAAQLVLVCLLAWLGTKGQAYGQALALLDEMAGAAAHTPGGQPRAVQVAERLHRRFGADVVELMALRLLKLPDWPAWRRRGAMLYLKQHAQPTHTEVLALLAAQARDPAEQDLAVQAVLQLQPQDPQLKPKLQRVQVGLAQQGAGLPSPLKALLQAP
jgi:hypothetical protein